LGQKAELKPRIREMILQNHAEELEWLRDAEGLTFDGIDYNNLKPLAQASSPTQSTDFQDFVPINNDAVNQLNMHLIQALAEQNLRHTKNQNRLEKKTLGIRPRAKKITKVLRSFFSSVGPQK